MSPKSLSDFIAASVLSAACELPWTTCRLETGLKHRLLSDEVD